jgi:hypothetical protein
MLPLNIMKQERKARMRSTLMVLNGWDSGQACPMCGFMGGLVAVHSVFEPDGSGTRRLWHANGHQCVLPILAEDILLALPDGTWKIVPKAQALP